MSVLINGKEMPKCCVACWAAEICRHYDRFSNCERPEHCPLVEVPEPHGRLIDADRLINELAKAIPYAIVSPTDETYVEGLSRAKIETEEAPTVIEAEEQEHDCGKSEEEKE